MTPLDTPDAILDFAIREEEAAFRFYTDLAAQSARPELRAALESFAHEEAAHKARLHSVKEGEDMLRVRAHVQDLKIADYLVELTPRTDMDYQEILVVAMQKEKAAYRMYTDLAARVEGPLRDLFSGLANEEARHKLHFETEYDQFVLKEN